jgi:hypothetical protein
MIRNVSSSTAAAGSSSTDAGLLPFSQVGPTGSPCCILPTTGADGTKGVRLHASDNVTGTIVFVANGVANQTLKIYPPTGGTINGASTDAAHVTASGAGCTLCCVNGSTGQWAAMS